MLDLFPNLDDRAKKFVERLKNTNPYWAWERYNGFYGDKKLTQIITTDQFMVATLLLVKWRQPEKEVTEEELDWAKEGSHTWELLTSIKSQLDSEYKLSEKLEKIILRGVLEDE